MYTMAVIGISDAFSEFTTVASSAWSFITGNWYLAALLIVPLGGLVVGTLMSMFRR